MKSFFQASASILLFLSSIFMLHAYAAGMKPEVPALFIDEDTREVTINVQNTDNEPALLHSNLQTIPEDRESKLIITPQLARVNAGQKQQVRVILKQGVTLMNQRMQRIDFVSIPQDDGKNNRTRILIGQNIPVIISPRDLPLNTEPWKLLSWQVSDNILKLKNSSKYIIRLTTNVDILPEGQKINIEKPYILPGESIDLKIKNIHAAKQVRIHPVTRFGVLTAPFIMDL